MHALCRAAPQYGGWHEHVTDLTVDVLPTLGELLGIDVPGCAYARRARVRLRWIDVYCPFHVDGAVHVDPTEAAAASLDGAAIPWDLPPLVRVHGMPQCAGFDVCATVVLRTRTRARHGQREVVAVLGGGWLSGALGEKVEGELAAGRRLIADTMQAVRQADTLPAEDEQGDRYVEERYSISNRYCCCCCGL